MSGSTGPKRPRGETRNLIRALQAEGAKPAEIAGKLGVCRSTVTFHLKRLDLPIQERFGQRYDWKEIRAIYEAGTSASRCREMFGFSQNAWADAVRRGAIRPRPRAMAIEELLVRGRRTARGHLKLRLLKAGLKENRCERCGIAEWQGGPLSMHLHHVNGDGFDNRLENLLFLCGNCHSQTDTYGGRNGHRRRQALLASHSGPAEPPPLEDGT